MVDFLHLNALWPSNIIWRCRSGSTLVQHQAITRTSVDLSSARSSDNHLRAISQEISQPSITEISLKNIYVKFYSILPGSNKLTVHFPSLLFQGVIFSMAYQPNLRVFCSVSDDRSIQLWQVTWPASSCRPGAWSEAEFQLIHTLYGHTARVWDIRLGAQCLVSVGEDATCCIWNYEGQVLKKLKGHKVIHALLKNEKKILNEKWKIWIHVLCLALISYCIIHTHR